MQGFEAVKTFAQDSLHPFQRKIPIAITLSIPQITGCQPEIDPSTSAPPLLRVDNSKSKYSVALITNAPVAGKSSQWSDLCFRSQLKRRE